MSEIELKTSAAQRKAVREYEKKNDRINVIFPAGTRDRMQAVGVKNPSTFIKEVVAAELERMEKYINSCDRATKQRLKIAIEKLPLGDVKKLAGLENDFRLRVGDLRILFSIEEDIIIINDILPRGQAYKRI